MGFVLVVFLVAMGLFVAFSVAKARTEALNRSWRDVAERLGLSLRPATWSKTPKLDGDIEGYPLSVDVHKRGSGNHQKVFTRFKLGVPGLPDGIELKREGFLSGISRAFGMHDIEVGDQAFDDKVLVKGNNKDAVLGFLTPARRVQISNFLDGHSGAVIDSKGVSWSSRGRMTDSARVLGTVEDLLQMARWLAGEEKPHVSPKQMLAEGEGILDDAMSILQGGISPGDAVAAASSKPGLGKAALATAGIVSAVAAAAASREGFGESKTAIESDGTTKLEAAAQPETVTDLEVAADSTAPAASRAAADSEIAVPESNGLEAASEPEAAVESEIAAQPSATTEPEAVQGAEALDVASFCNAVFAPGALSFEATKAFEHGFSGRRVKWQGTLQAAAPYRFDFVFGSGTGVKATLAIYKSEASGLRNGDVKAVLQLPAETEGLEAKIGERLSFAGTLLKVDGLMRTVFVADARLL